jgi:phosphoadenosine phosphosulfate reductase
MQGKADDLNRNMTGKTPEQVVAFFLEQYRDKVALASSMGIEDQVLTDMMWKQDKNARIFTIDTGRLFPETYSLIDRTNLHYSIKIQVYFPERQGVECFVRTNGMNGFYESVELRKECCRVRKIEPLLRALKPLDVWICGLRQEQSVTRSDVRTVEWDQANNLIKVNPLVHWSEEDVKNYIKVHGIPYNRLHDKGFPSIGCQPCTRAVQTGEDLRAGRWWWENPEHKECGLHRR